MFQKQRMRHGWLPAQAVGGVHGCGGVVELGAAVLRCLEHHDAQPVRRSKHSRAAGESCPHPA
tara:strand:- start:5326 stop:5514 length:189 start_codon:yes stop_codon:yes gene_type:complete